LRREQLLCVADCLRRTGAQARRCGKRQVRHLDGPSRETGMTHDGLEIFAMTRGEWVVQLIKIALGAAIGIYFIWWSLEVLHRLPLH
jgi:hypothetical protein